MKPFIAFVGVFLLLVGIGRATDEKEPSWQSKWQNAWDHSMTVEGRVAVCAAWDVTPSAAAIQVEEAMHLPPGTGLGKRMLKQVC